MVVDVCQTNPAATRHLAAQHAYKQLGHWQGAEAQSVLHPQRPTVHVIHSDQKDQADPAIGAPDSGCAQQGSIPYQLCSAKCMRSSD